MSYLKIASDLKPNSFEIKNQFIDCFIELHKNERNFENLKIIFSFCSELENENLSNEKKIEYWNHCYEISKYLNEKVILIECLIKILSIKWNSKLELELIQLLKSHSKFEQIQKFYWEKYLKTKDPLDLISFSSNFIFNFQSKFRSKL